MASKKKSGKKGETVDVIDLVKGKDDAEPYVYAEEIMKQLLKKGFCAIDSGMTEMQLQEMLAEVQQMNNVGKFDRPADEVVEGLLGPVGSVRLVTVDTETEFNESSPIERLDRQILDMAAIMEPFTQPYFGFELSTRSPSYLLEGGQGTDLPPTQLTAKDCIKWLNIFQWHRFMCIFFIGPTPGVLELQPFDDTSGGHTLNIRPGMWVVLRADMLTHRFNTGGVSYTLSSFFMQMNSDAELRRKQANFEAAPIAQSLDRWLSNAMRTMKETIETEEEMEAIASRDVQRLSNHMYHRGQQIAIRGCAVRYGGRASQVFYMQSVLFSGCDAAEPIPFMRWDNEQYYRSEPQDGYYVRDTYTCMHSVFIEGIEMFDYKFFGLSINETRGMDPNQRHMLEVCYETCFSGGFRKPTLMRSHMGVYSGGPAGELEWSQIPKTSESGALASTSGSPAILSNRLSYTFGMNGPNYLMDMEAASSLLAFQQAVDCCLPQRPQAESAIALGVDTILSPGALGRLCWAGLMSTRGRCFSFDHTADGYIRGEGCGGVFMNPLLHEVDNEFVMDDKLPLQAIASGAYCNNSGKTASLTAPNGHTDQELIAGTLRRAEISALDVDFVEPHSPGSLLSDAVEVTALVKSYRINGMSAEEMLGIGSVKGLLGNTKPASGIVAVVKQMICSCFGNMAATAHLMRVNPHMLLDDMPMLVTSEHVANRMNSTFTGISAKGIGGANVHAIIWGQVDFKRVHRPTIVPTCKPISFWPGGGGELEDDAKPNKNYTIVGSWSGWSDPQPMEPEGKGVFGYTITLGEHALERFQILLDGDANKLLHPKVPDAPCDAPVYGPDRSQDAEMNYWLINGQPQYVGLVDREKQQALTDEKGGDGLNWVQTNLKEAGVPGEQYRIQLLVNGQYRVVTWEKVMEGSEDAIVPAKAEVPVGKYSLMSSWNGWSPEQMTADKEKEGVFYVESQLTRHGGTFNIVRNQDDRQTIYPEYPYCDDGAVSPVLGPDDQGRAYYWYVAGEPGEMVRIELRREYKDGIVTMGVSWTKVGHSAVPPDLLRDVARSQFYVVGTLGKWKKRNKMTFNGKYFAFELSIRLGNTENFQILMEGDWNLMIYPPEEDSPKDSMLKGPDELGQGLYWTLGLADDERSGRFEVQLYVAGGRPVKLTWVRK
mmetsp:Transcript_105942/g.330399  ORF Transcript_105942/g.330399 Transcript_105942/m.330399 type:complete len:1163 (-) Transcript_105942:221-3709(-)